MSTSIHYYLVKIDHAGDFEKACKRVRQFHFDHGFTLSREWSESASQRMVFVPPESLDEESFIDGLNNLSFAGVSGSIVGTLGDAVAWFDNSAKPRTIEGYIYEDSGHLTEREIAGLRVFAEIAKRTGQSELDILQRVMSYLDGGR